MDVKLIASGRTFSPASPFPGLVVGSCFTALLVLLTLANASPPRIDRILRTTNLGRAQVEIHFYSDVNRTYVLQAINALPCGTNQGCSTNAIALTNWSNLATVFALPYTQHFVYPDSRTNRARFYRLRVTP